MFLRNQVIKSLPHLRMKHFDDLELSLYFFVPNQTYIFYCRSQYFSTNFYNNEVAENTKMEDVQQIRRILLNREKFV